MKYKGFEIKKLNMVDQKTGKIIKYTASNHRCHEEWWTTNFTAKTIKEIKRLITEYKG